jgi:DNA-binding transcriptional MerR regulator
MSDPDIANGAAAQSGEDGGVDAGASPGIDAETTEIPDKLYFRIGEVARLAAIKPYVLRFWETEFPSLGPRKSGTGHRLYRRKDVEQVLEIKRLLYEKRFTIEGARKFMEDRVRSTAAAASAGAKGKGRGKAARAAAAGAETGAGPAGHQKGLFDGPSPAVLDLVRKELKALAEMLK